MAWRGQFSRFFIGGEWVAPGSTDTLPVTNPYTGEIVARVAAGTAADMERAVAAARDAFDRGPWPRASLAERLDVLRRLSVRIGENAEAFAGLVTEEMGCPIALSRGFQSIGAKLALDAFLELAPSYPWRSMRQASTGRALVLREPVGVVAAVIPWNAPLQIAAMNNPTVCCRTFAGEGSRCRPASTRCRAHPCGSVRSFRLHKTQQARFRRRWLNEPPCEPRRPTASNGQPAVIRVVTEA